MIFEKKVIIGSITSILGLIVTAITVTAIFFPNIFNLQKEKIETLSIGIKTDDDVKRFYDFISERIKDRKIFKLEAFVCDNSSRKIYTYKNTGELWGDNINFSVFDDNRYSFNRNDLIRSNYFEKDIEKTAPLIFNNNFELCSMPLIDQDGKYVMSYAHNYDFDNDEKCLAFLEENMNYAGAIIYHFPIDGVGIVPGNLPDGSHNDLEIMESLCGKEVNGFGVITYAYFDKQEIIEGIDPIGGEPEEYRFKVIDERDVKMKNY